MVFLKKQIYLKAIAEKFAKNMILIISLKILTLRLTSNIEEQCRKARYRELCENCQDDEVMITAHHEEDQIETFFLRLIRGSGARGLSCMKETSIYGSSLLSRPFLNISKRRN